MISKIAQNKHARSVLIGHLTNLLKFNVGKDFDKVAKGTTDLEFLAYYHAVFVKSPLYKTFDVDKDAYQKKLYDKKSSIINDMISLKGKKVLDIGQEDYYYSQTLLRNGATDVKGINVQFYLTYGGDKSNIIIYDGVNIPFEEGTFDVVLIHMVLHHVIKDHDKLLKDVYRVLKKGGVFVIEDHNFDDDITNEIIDFYHYAYELVASKKFDVDYYNNYEIRRFTYGDLKRELEEIGFRELVMKVGGGQLRKYYCIAKK